MGILVEFYWNHFPCPFFFSKGKNKPFKMEEKSDFVLRKIESWRCVAKLFFKTLSLFPCTLCMFNPQEYVRAGFTYLPFKANFSETCPFEMTLSSWCRNYLNKVAQLKCFMWSFMGLFSLCVLFKMYTHPQKALHSQSLENLVCSKTHVRPRHEGLRFKFRTRDLVSSMLAGRKLKH